MTSPATASAARTTQRTAVVYAGGSCGLACAVCDCRVPSSAADVERGIQGGGSRLVVRGPTDASPLTAEIVRRARQEGFAEIADWFETLAKAERSHANRFQKALDALAD